MMEIAVKIPDGYHIVGTRTEGDLAIVVVEQHQRPPIGFGEQRHIEEYYDEDDTEEDDKAEESINTDTILTL